MIKEIVQFMETVPEAFKSEGIKPKEGLHILLRAISKDGLWSLDLDNMVYDMYSTKMPEASPFIASRTAFCESAWMIDTNKCFDAPDKAIHSCSPYLVAFKRDHLKGGESYKDKASKGKPQLEKRMERYFNKAQELIGEDIDTGPLSAFRVFFTHGQDGIGFLDVLKQITAQRKELYDALEIENAQLKQQLAESKDKTEKEHLKQEMQALALRQETVRALTDKDYVLFYLDSPIDAYQACGQKYLSDKLFNTGQYNLTLEDDGEVYGTNNFFNGFNSSMPFLLHQTAMFGISGRITASEARHLHDFHRMLPRKVLPNPLPIFVYSEELQKAYVNLFKENEGKLGYKEIIEDMWENHAAEFANYYLLYYQNTKDGIVFRDFDFVSRFLYELKGSDGQSPWYVQGLIGSEKERNAPSSNYPIHNVFQFQDKILQKVFDNGLVVMSKGNSIAYKYFDDIEEKYCKSEAIYQLILTYRQACYNFVYKSQRHALDRRAFDNIMRTGILEAIRLDKMKDGQHSERFNILSKLNIWFSLAQHFDSHHSKPSFSMANQLHRYRAFVKSITEGITPTEASDDEIMFAAGQVIAYLISKSRSADSSYSLLEPYLQQSQWGRIKQAIATDFARYKHENYSRRFDHVAAYILAHESQENAKAYLPQILAGVFDSNLLFSEKKNDATGESPEAVA